MNYGQLKTLLSGYLHRTDLESLIPTFVALAQSRVNTDLKDPGMVSRATFTADGTSRYVTLPSAVVELKDVQVQTSAGRQSILPLSPTQMDALYSTLVTSGDPAHYCLRGRELEIQPTPASGTDVEITYLGGEDLWTDDADTSALLTKYPNIFVYASMMEACIYIQGDERLPAFQKAYAAEVARINTAAEDLEFSGGPIQIMKLGVSTP